MKTPPPARNTALVLLALALLAAHASSEVLAQTDFTGRTVSGRTASNISWTVSGLESPGPLTWENDGGGPSSTPLFNTPDSQGHFAPNLNIDNEGPWRTDIPLTPTLSDLQVEEVVIDWRHFNNSGEFQTADRTANWTVEVRNSASELLATKTAFGVTGREGVQTITFDSPASLTSGESHTLRIRVIGTTVGNNTGLDALTINGTIGPAPSPPPFQLSIQPAPTGDGYHFTWPSRSGMRYNLLTSSDLSQPLATWTTQRGDMIPTPPMNTEPVAPAGDARFFVVEEVRATPLNVLLIIADDWRHDTLGSAGHPVIQTPALDSLAAEGLRFTQAASTTAVCWVSRASIFMGQWMSRHGQTKTGTSMANWSQSFPSQLRQNGYWVGHVGKWHNGAFPSADHDFGRIYHGRHWYNVGGEDVHVTQRNENDALDFLRNRPADQPFLLTVATFAPHAEDGNSLQYLPQPETTALYTDIAVPVPVNATNASFQRLPSFLATEQNEGRIRWHWRFDTPEKYQTMMKNYFRLCTGVDTMCGNLIAELALQEVLDDTLVIFIGDNGYFHAEHGLADKWYPFQESIRVPLIIRDPRLPVAERGTTHDAYALNVDLAPTILEAAGVAPPPDIQGKDLGPLYLASLPPQWRDEFFYEHPTISNTSRIPSSEALVRRDWKYFYWPDFDTEQLFDIVTDPIEENDRAADPLEAARLAEMRTRFAELKAAQGSQ